MGIIHSKPSKNYERLLTHLQTEIKSQQASLQRLRTLNRSCQVHLVLFSSVFYGGYALFIFLQRKLVFHSNPSPFSLAFLLLFPVAVFYAKKAIRWGFGIIVRKRQKSLEIKQAELKDRLEELKVETGYYKTKTLIEKYDEAEKQNVKQSEIRKRPERGIEAGQTSVTVGPRSNAVGNLNPNVHTYANTLNSPPLHRLPPPPPSPSFKSPTWMDRFMDALIGDDSRNQKYALICAQCFNHNGLAAPETFASIKYRCPNCGFMNVNALKSTVNESRIEEVKDHSSVSSHSSSSDSFKSLESDNKED